MKGVFISLLLAGLSQAVQVYLNPSPALPPRLSASRGSAALSRHLGLEQFEPLGEDSPLLNGQQESFVGQGLDSAMLLTISEEVAKDVIPSTLKLAFTLVSKPSLSSLSILIPSYIDRAQHVYSHVFSQASAPGIPPTAEILSVLSPTFAPYLAEMAALVDFLESDEVPTDKFAAFALTGLAEMAEQYGRTGEQYRLAADVARNAIELALKKPGLKLAVVTVPTDALVKRQDTDASDLLQPPQSPLPGPSPGPAEPIGSVSTCFESAAACGNATDGCSGHGECVQASKAGKTCFVCACGATRDEKGRTENWAGTACERRDVSGPFVLLAGTTVTLVLLIAGSVALLSGVGEQQLPSTLTGGIGGISRRD